MRSYSDLSPSLRYYRCIYLLLRWFIAVTCFLCSSVLATPQLHGLSVELEPNNDVVAFVLPVPNHLIKTTQRFSLTNGGNNVDFSVSAHMLWPSQENNMFVRALRFEFKEPQNGKLSLQWGAAEITPLSPMVSDSSQNKLSDVSIPKGWLNQALYSPVIDNADNLDWHWFDQAYLKYAAYVSDEALILKVGTAKNKNAKVTLPSKAASPWLYDRPYTLYQLYFKTGDLHWKRLAHEQASFYIDLLDDDGYFSLKSSPDLKYLLSAGLLIDYQLYPDPKTKQAIIDIAANGDKWPTAYSPKWGFWTERNLSVALSLAMNRWEIEPNKGNLKRLQNLISGTRDTLWVSAPGQGGCIKHTIRAHEGKSGKDLLCSPWMSALVVEQLWKLYWLENNKEVAQLIIDFSDMLQHKGIYQIKEKGKVKYIPDYLVFFEKSIYEDRNSWSDRQHACDVTGMMFKGVYLKKTLGQDEFLLELLAHELLTTCKSSMARKGKKWMSKPYWGIKPLRKFNWWYGSNGSLTWLLQQS